MLIERRNNFLCPVVGVHVAYCGIHLRDVRLVNVRDWSCTKNGQIDGQTPPPPWTRSWQTPSNFCGALSSLILVNVALSLICLNSQAW